MISTCVKCGKMNMFETVEAEPARSNYKLIYLQCSPCGGVAGVLEYFNAGQELSQLNRRVEGLEARVEEVAVAIRTLASRIR